MYHPVARQYQKQSAAGRPVLTATVTGAGNLLIGNRLQFGELAIVDDHPAMLIDLEFR